MIINEIDTKEISIVFQGAVDLAVTPGCIRAAAASFPGAEIILSTWKNAAVSEMDVDKILFNKDPGGMKCSHAIDNTNRQIVTTRNGVNQATRKYILKLRSDCLVKSPKMLSYWEKYPYRDRRYCWLKHRVIMPTLYCKRFLDCCSKIPVPFHYSDWLQFGLAEDIKKIWNIDIINPKEFINFYSFKMYTGNKLQRIWMENRYVAETYIYYSSIKKSYPQIRYLGADDYNSENMRQSEQILYNNFILMEADSLDFIIEKEPYHTIIQDVNKFRKAQPGCYYTEKEFAKIYERSVKQ